MKMEASDSIVAAEAFNVGGFADPMNKASYLGTGADSAVAHILQHSLFYERVVIASEDSLVLLPLIEAFGPAGLEELLEKQIVSVCFTRGQPVVGSPGDNTKTARPFIISWWSSDRSVRKGALDPEAEFDRFVSLCAERGIRGLSKSRLLETSRSVDFEATGQSMIDRAMKWLRESERTRRWIGIDLDDAGELQLPITEPNKFTALSFNTLADKPTHRLLEYFQIACLRDVLLSLNTPNFSTSRLIHRAVVEAVWSRHNSTGSMADVAEMARIPHIGGHLLRHPGDLQKYIRLRETAAAIKFRHWFQNEAAGRDTREVARALADMLQSEPAFANSISKTIRFLVTSALASVGVVGFAASAADSLLVDPLLGRREAKAFFHRVRQLASE